MHLTTLTAFQTADKTSVLLIILKMLMLIYVLMGVYLEVHVGVSVTTPVHGDVFGFMQFSACPPIPEVKP